MPRLCAALLLLFLIPLSGCKRAQDAATQAKDRVVQAVGSDTAKAALEIGRVLSDAVDSDTSIDPVYEELDDEEARHKTDAAIAAMPSVQVIDGLKVGMEDVTRTTTEKHETRRAFAVIWRQGDRRVGFIYKTRRTIDLATLATEAPRLIELARNVIE